MKSEFLYDEILQLLTSNLCIILLHLKITHGTLIDELLTQKMYIGIPTLVSSVTHKYKIHETEILFILIRTSLLYAGSEPNKHNVVGRNGRGELVNRWRKLSAVYYVAHRHVFSGRKPKF